MSNDQGNQPYQDPDEDLLREHVFDGIQEYDKKLPNWWLMTLYGAIVFSICYWFFYHVTDVGQMPEEKLARAQARTAAMAALDEGGSFDEERLLAMSRDDALVGSGRNAFASNCASCHGAGAEGGIGPNLTDGDWMHGGDPEQILTTILDGVPAKGMPAWKSMIGESRSAEITAFILSLSPERHASAGAGE